VFIAIVYHPMHTLQELFKNRFFLTKILRSGIYQTYKKTSRKIPEVFFGSSASPGLLYLNKPGNGS
jgi:hypothetical protein